MSGNAAKNAGRNAIEQLLKVVAEEMEVDVEDLVARNRKIFVKGSPDQGMSFRKALKTYMYRDLPMPIVGSGFYQAPIQVPDWFKAENDPAATYSFGAQIAVVEVDPDTADLIRRYAENLAQAAAERQRDELMRILATPRAGMGVRLLDDLALLERLLPELTDSRGVEQPKEHYWDVLEHSIETVATIEFLLRIEGLRYSSDEVLNPVPWSLALEEHFEQDISSGHRRKTLLKLAGLLHDIAKPQTRSIDEKGRTRFLGHAREGATVAQGMMERLRFSVREKEIVQKMIEHHLRPGQLAGEDELPTKRAIYRYFRDTGDVGIDTIFLNLADHLATRGPNLELEEWRRHTRSVSHVLEERFSEVSVVSQTRLINGHDLIDILGMSPGPEMGRLLEAVREAQAAGEVTTRDEALRFVQKRNTKQS